MGGKPSRAGQRVYFCLAALSLAWACGLRPPPPPPPPPLIVPPVVEVPPPAEPAPVVEVKPPEPPREQEEAQDHLRQAQSMLARGDFEGSVRESQRAIALAKENAPADAATFHMGLIYAHPKNPKKDNKRAMGFFNRVIKTFPESPWVEQAKIWSGVLDGIEKLKQVDLEIEEKKRDRVR